MLSIFSEYRQSVLYQLGRCSIVGIEYVSNVRCRDTAVSYTRYMSLCIELSCTLVYISGRDTVSSTNFIHNLGNLAGRNTLQIHLSNSEIECPSDESRKFCLITIFLGGNNELFKSGDLRPMYSVQSGISVDGRTHLTEMSVGTYRLPDFFD